MVREGASRLKGRWADRYDLFMLRHDGHRLHPYLHIPSRAAWWLAWRAWRKGMDVSDLVSEIVARWADMRIAELGDAEFADFAESIPFYRPELHKA